MAADESPGVLERAYRTVTPGVEPHPDSEMNAIGWAMFLILVAILVPLLPILLAVWVVTKLLDYAAAQTRDAEE